MAEGEGRRAGGQHGLVGVTTQSGQLRAVLSEAVARAHGGGGLANRGGRWGTGEAGRGLDQQKGPG
jgi:hypothetical protein